MGMHKNFMDILNVLYFDETLLRLLYYSPLNITNKTPEPLDSSLPNVIDIDTDYDIRYSRIMKIPKDSDLTPDKPMCRLFVYFGRRKADSNYAMADQEIIFDILCHNEIENGDLRSARIADRLNELLVAERITGIGKTNYLNGSPISAPTEYIGYRHVYEFGEFRK